ncbi:unnamed protein product [Lasius platythorax]|uniref:Endonuclease/exonuclease/phosphatase domain-containing protein n=1 Tax=Lasius platythorax TaxID=488582 RepID=A0AAV2NMH3_9HYME
MGEKLEIMREWMEENGNGIKTMMGGDFNARTGELGKGVREEGDVGGGGRVSMDKKVNGNGRLLVSKLEEVGLEIMNGGVAGDEKGKWTYWIYGREKADGNRLRDWKWRGEGEC